MRKDSTYYDKSINILQNATIFQGVDLDTIEDILCTLTPMTLPRKSTIHYTKTYKYFYIILTGRVKISKINPENGREYIISLLKKGDVFDIVTFLTNKEQEINIEAVEEIELLETSMQTARALLDQNPIFYKNFLPYVGKRVEDFKNAASNLALYNTKTRLAKLILDHAHKHIKGDEYSVKHINDLSHDALSQMIGSVRKIVNLNIQELKKDKIITSSRGNLSILDINKLRKICY